MAASPHVVDVTIETFEREIIERSNQVPVVIDFWAPWCQPCLQLKPILEKLANEYQGKFVLAKINVEEEQQIGAAFGIQSIPHVIAFAQGQPIDQFQGVLPETKIREWLDRLMPSPAEQLAQAALAVEESNPQEAESKYREALSLEPDAAPIKIRLAGLLLKAGRLEEARSIIDALNQRGYLEPEAERILAELDLRQTAQEAGGVEAARKAAEADPQNLALKIQLADALAAVGQHRKALELCLDVVSRDRAGAGVDAKATMLKIFEVLGPASELTGEFRRKLATVLY